jgi:predicted NBD/HSP70 family sugar kinase
MLPASPDDLVREDQAHGLVSSPIRQANAELIANLLRQVGPLSRADLVRRSGLTRPTVVAIVRSLLQEGIATESGVRRPTEPGGTGRPGTLLHFNTRVRTVVASRLFGGHLIAQLIDAHGTVLAESDTVVGVDPAAFLPRAAAAIEQLSQSIPGVGPLGAVSVLMPGLISRRTGECVSHPRRDWRNVPVRAELEQMLKVPVTVLSPASAAVLGEVERGSGRGHQNMVLVFLDVGIAAGIMTGGQLLHGTDGMVGELGHCQVAGATSACGCGKVGCLETVASGRHLREQARRILGKRAVRQNTTLGNLEAIGNPELDTILDRAATTLGLAASWLVNLLNPSIVILGGTTFAAGAPKFFATFQDAVRDGLMVGHPAPPAFAVADGHAAELGAIQAALEKLPRRLRPPSRYGV